jgi:chitin disaccharide deacetylase
VLIVNADDVGASPNATDAAIEAFGRGAICSCSAMVWMRDSARAAQLARDRDMPVGLHLNLTLPFDATEVPRVARERQLRLTETLHAGSWREDIADRPPRQLLLDAVSDQLEQFRELFGEPTHLDGHHHVHVLDAVLDVLPTDLVIRPILREGAQADARASRRERRLHRRFQAPSVTLAFEHIHPALGGAGFAALERARSDLVEVMCHPQQAGQLEALMSVEWRAALARLPVGSYSALRRDGRD